MATTGKEQSAVRREIESLVSARPEISFALLFGSRAGNEDVNEDENERGRAPRAGSDWDVAVYLNEDLSARQRFAVRRQMIVDLEALGGLEHADVVILNDAPALLGHRALQGELFLDRDRVAYVRYFVRTLGASGDEAYFRRLHREARRQRLAEGTFGRP